MKNLKINSIDRSVFDAAGVEDVNVVAQDGTKVSRRDIVAVSRLLAVEYAGRHIADRPGFEGSHTSRLNGQNYSDLSRSCTDKTLLFCAGMANRAVGKEAPASIEEVKNDISYAKNETFIRTLASISSDVLRPIFFDIISDVAMGGLMQFESVPFGGVKEIEIASNDVFLFEDSAWGSARSSSFNELFNKTVTINPRPFTCQAKIKWYQLAVNGDIGAYYSAIMRGMWNKIYAMFISALLTGASDSKKVPSGLSASTYTTDNWATITTLVAAANGIRRDNLLAFGGIKALNKVLPIDGTGAAITGLQYGLGEEWFKQGYLPNAAGVQLVEVTPAIVPGTQNSTLVNLNSAFDSEIFIAAKAGYGYAPVYGGYYEGSPLSLEMRPEQTGDLTIDITVTAMFDMKPLFASKIGLITDIA